MQNTDMCSDWMLEQLASLAKGRARVWLRDPDRLLPSSGAEIQTRTAIDQCPIVVNNSLALRNATKGATPTKWILVDQTRPGDAGSNLFVPDLSVSVSTQNVSQR